MNKHILKAEDRELTGRKVRRLRADGIVPATMYGKKSASKNLQVQTDELIPLYRQVGETGLVELLVGERKHAVLITNIQVHPVTGNALHVDFREVDLTQKVKASVPVELVGESPAEKQGIGTAVLLVNEIEVEALPADLPEKFEIDATNLTEVDQVVTVSDLKFDKSKVEVQSELDLVLAKVEPPQKEEEIVEAAPVEGAEAATTEAAAGTEAEATAEEKKSE